MSCSTASKKSLRKTELRIRNISQLLFAGLLLAFSLFPPGAMAFAQTPEPTSPVYIVQDGDSLWSIAVRFGLTLDELSNANNITDPNQLVTGARLTIPGLRNIQGVLTTRSITFGETLRSLSRRHHTSIEALVQLNHLTSPVELFPGSTLVIPEPVENMPAARRAMLLPGQSVFELALLNHVNPWSLVLDNQISNTQQAAPGEVFHITGSGSSQDAETSPGALPQEISSITFKPTVFYQGKIGVIRLTGQEGINLEGMLVDQKLQFFADDDGGYVSLQGIHAMQEPGLYTMTITGTLPLQEPYGQPGFSFSQSVLIRRGDYPFDPVLVVSPETIDPAVTKPEDAEWSALAAPVTAEKLWHDQFLSPAPPPFSDCWPSTFGNRRSYNGSAYSYFHTGLDFCGGVGTEILAPAAGVVVFAGPLTVRGNATMINHGWGVYSGYMHQSEIKVEVGDVVEPGQVIGLVGGTGRVTGPHLHWEIWAGGIQIDPMDWLEQVFP